MDKQGKVTEKMLNARIFVSALVIALCLAAMAFTAYAYYASSVVSSNNVIHSGKFDVIPSVRVGAVDGETVELTSNASEKYQAMLTSGATYYVTLQVTEETTATGFVIVELGDSGAAYHTQPLGNGGEGITGTLTFKIVPDETGLVTIRTSWGTSSMFGYQNENNPLYITTDKEIILAAQSSDSEMPQSPVEQQPTETTPPETIVPQS